MYAEQCIERLDRDIGQYLKGNLPYKRLKEETYINDVIMHSERVTSAALLIARHIGLSEEEQKELYLAGIYHDIGKANVPASVLFKPGPLSKLEMKLTQMHVTHGANYLQSKGYPKNIVDTAHYHHERYDGTGYPMGFSGNKIPLFAKIVAIADSYDAMTHPRIYRSPITEKEALEEIEKCIGKQYDPDIAKYAIQSLERHSLKKQDMLPVKI